MLCDVQRYRDVSVLLLSLVMITFISSQLSSYITSTFTPHIHIHTSPSS